MAEVALRRGSVFVQASFQHLSVYAVLISIISEDDEDTECAYTFQKIASVLVKTVVHDFLSLDDSYLRDNLLSRISFQCLFINLPHPFSQVRRFDDCQRTAS